MSAQNQANVLMHVSLICQKDVNSHDYGFLLISHSAKNIQFESEEEESKLRVFRNKGSVF